MNFPNLESNLEGVCNLIQILRSEDGCPWDQEQTSNSLTKHLIEESYELVEAIENHDLENIEEEIEAFGLRYPLNRLALIYCRGRSFGKGHATSILQRIELEAFNEGHSSLITEASLCSYPLLIRLGWKIIQPEKILIGGVSFDRYLMKRQLN